jgi:SnoaL-like domain
MDTFTTLIDDYLIAYGEPEQPTRAALIERVFGPDAVLTDPPYVATGHAELDASFAAVQSHYPGHRFSRTSAIDEHHGTARYTWQLASPDGAVALAGMDVVVFDEDRIARVTGFFGTLPPEA